MVRLWYAVQCNHAVKHGCSSKLLLEYFAVPLMLSFGGLDLSLTEHDVWVRVRHKCVLVAAALLQRCPIPAHTTTHSHTHTQPYTHTAIHTHTHTHSRARTHAHAHTQHLIDPGFRVLVLGWFGDGFGMVLGCFRAVLEFI